MKQKDNIGKEPKGKTIAEKDIEGRGTVEKDAEGRVEQGEKKLQQNQGRNVKLKGIRCILYAAFFFSLMTLFVKLSGEMPIYQKVFFRNLVAFWIALFVMIKKKVPFQLGGKKENVGYLLGRCILGTSGVIGNFYAITYMNIADSSMLNKLSPFFAMILSVFVLKERAKKKEWLAVVIAFIGALFVIKPSFQMEMIPALAGFYGGFGAGAAYTCVRKLGQNGVRGEVIVLSFSLFSCVSMIPFMCFTYQPMGWMPLLFLLLAGAAAAGGQFSITAAYTYAPAKEISVFDYTQVIFAALLSFVILGDLPDVYSFIGYAIIIATAIWKWRYNLKNG